MSQLVSRDPFARMELHRKREYIVSRACDWCGGVKKTPKGRFYLFCYTSESDGGRRNELRGRFCSNGCMRSYHEQ